MAIIAVFSGCSTNEVWKLNFEAAKIQLDTVIQGESYVKAREYDKIEVTDLDNMPKNGRLEFKKNSDINTVTDNPHYYTLTFIDGDIIAQAHIEAFTHTQIDLSKKDRNSTVIKIYSETTGGLFGNQRRKDREKYWLKKIVAQHYQNRFT